MSATDIKQFQAVEASIESWMDFCEYALTSEYYKNALESVKDRETAARVTLLWTYLNTFSVNDRKMAEEEPEVFYRYATGFIDELAMARYRPQGYDKDTRAVFLGKIKKVLKAQKGPDGELSNPDMFLFLKTIVRFCSNLDFIITSYDHYKDHMFRHRPAVVRPQAF